MTFEKHLFISYAHLDNEPLSADCQGWITRFHATLSPLLSMRLGRKAEIWRDSKLTGNDIFAEEIVQQFPKTAALIAILTPRYMASEWCTRELHEFCKIAESDGGLIHENKSRAFKIIKTPVDSEASLPSAMRDVLGHPFYRLVQEEIPIELDPSYGEELAQEYNLKIAMLAWDVAQIVKKLDSRAESSVPPPKSPLPQCKPGIYLAECSYDRRDARQALELELRQLGYSVLPDRQLPRDEAAYRSVVEDALTRCKLSIHLIGQSYGAVPDGCTDKSVVVLQNELAIARSKQGLLQRVISLPDGTTSEVPQQQQFIASLHSHAEAQFGADLITGDLESVKGAIFSALDKLDKLDKREPRTLEPRTGDAALSRIHVICDARDLKDTVPLRKFLKIQGYEVQIPLFDGDAARVRQANEMFLLGCDAVILFYGAGGDDWKHTVENDLQRIKALRRDRVLPRPFVYLAPPTTSKKTDMIDMEETNLIDGLGGFEDALMQPFLDAFAKAPTP